MAMNVTSDDKKGPGASNDEDKCTICNELFKSIAEKTFLPCAHYFHKGCIDKWLAKDDSCPICRSFTNGESAPEAATVYPDENKAADAYATFGAMPQPQQMENGTGSLNCFGRQNCIGCLNCTNCINCINCLTCTNCINCINCLTCTNCQVSANCVTCINCPNCINCITLIHSNNTTHGGNFYM